MCTLSTAETDAAIDLRLVQCPRCRKPVPLRRWFHLLDLCADCLRELFGIEMREDGRYQLTPEREIQDKAIRVARETRGKGGLDHEV